MGLLLFDVVFIEGFFKGAIENLPRLEKSVCGNFSSGFSFFICSKDFFSSLPNFLKSKELKSKSALPYLKLSIFEKSENSLETAIDFDIFKSFVFGEAENLFSSSFLPKFKVTENFSLKFLGFI